MTTSEHRSTLADPSPGQPPHGLATSAPPPSARRRNTRLWWQLAGLALLFAAGLWLRSLSPARFSSALGDWRPWARPTVLTLYFSDGDFLFPVSRRTEATDLPRAVVQAVLEGPAAATGLRRSVPSGVEIRSIDLTGGVADVDLSAAFLGDPDGVSLAQAALIDTLTALPGVNAVTLRVEGRPIVQSARRTPLLYYPSARGLVALPTDATDPRSAVTAYLAGPGDPALTGFPADVRLLHYSYEPADRLLSLGLTYSPSVRTLALERPERMRTLLLGLITSLTEYPAVRAVQLDFEGQARLGLGQCSDLLRTPQPHPQLLNDERLLEPLRAPPQ